MGQTYELYPISGGIIQRLEGRNRINKSGMRQIGDIPMGTLHFGVEGTVEAGHIDRFDMRCERNIPGVPGSRQNTRARTAQLLKYERRRFEILYPGVDHAKELPRAPRKV